MTASIRPATADDVATIAEFNARLAMETEGKRLEPDVVHSGVRRAIETDRGATYVVADEGDEVVGQLMFTREWSDWRDGMIWWLQSVYVRDDRRGRGVFRSLLEHVVDRAKKDPDVCMLRLCVEVENRAAQQTYRRMAFREVGYRVYERDV